MEKTLRQNELNLISGLQQMSGSEHMDSKKHIWRVRGQLSPELPFGIYLLALEAFVNVCIKLSIQDGPHPLPGLPP